MIKTGLARFEYRHFPIFGRQSEFGALATECGADQGRFWDFHDQFMSGRQSLYSRQGALGLAEELGLDVDAFTTCIDDERHVPSIESGQRLARERGIRGTPTVFVNDRPVSASADAIIAAVQKLAE